MITRLSLKNWRSHLDSTFTFSPGVNGLVGIMGSGKTSVLQAMSFAFFGTFPQLQSKRIKLDDLIMKRPRRQDRAEVELEFRVNNRQYTIRRVVEQEKGTTHAELRENGQLLDVTPQGVTAEVQRLLKIDYDLYAKAVYAEQDGLDYFLRIPKGQRMQHIDRMLKLDRFETARAGAVALYNKIQIRRKEKIRILADLETEQIERQLDDALKEKVRQEEERTRLTSRLEQIAQERRALTRQYEGALQTEKMLHQARQQLEGVTAAIIEIEASIRERQRRLEGKNIDRILHESRQLEEQLQELSDQLLFKRTEEGSRRSELASLNTRFMQVSKGEIPKISQRLAELERDQERFTALDTVRAGRELAATETWLEKEERLATRLETRLEQQESHLRDIQKRRTCPTCESAIPEKKRAALLKTRKTEIGQLKKDITVKAQLIENLRAEVAELKTITKEMEQLTRRLNERPSLQKMLQEYDEELAALRKDINRCAETLSALSAAIPSLENALKDRAVRQEQLKAILEDARFVWQAEKRLAEYRQRESELTKQSSQFAAAVREAHLDDLRQHMEQRIGEASELSARRAALEEKLQESQRVIRDLTERENRLQAYRLDVERDEVMAASLGRFTEVLRATQDHLRGEFVATVNQLMQQVWSELYPYGDFHGIRLTVDNDYVLQLQQKDQWVSTDVVSGGERSLAVLALRIAFSLAFLPRLKWLILDEPTHNLDRNAIATFSEILREKINQFAEQVFLITHEERIADGLTGMVYRLERNKAIGEPTRVVAV